MEQAIIRGDLRFAAANMAAGGAADCGTVPSRRGPLSFPWHQVDHHMVKRGFVRFRLVLAAVDGGGARVRRRGDIRPVEARWPRSLGDRVIKDSGGCCVTDRNIGRSSGTSAGELPDLGTVRQIYELAEVARERSIRAAARSLKISENTLRRHIEALEQRLGETLIERSHRGVVLTEAGHHIVSTGQQMQEAYHANYRLSNKRQRRAASGTLRLGATDGLATYWLMPHLAQYQAQNPQLNVQLVCDLGVEERSYGASDISIRLSPTSDEAYVSSPLATLHLLPYAAPAYLERYGKPSGIEDWQTHRIVWQSGVDLRSVLPAYLPLSARTNIVLESNSSALHYAAIRDGAGIGMLPTYASLVDPDLVPLDILNPAPRQQLYLTYRRQLLDCRARIVHWVRRIFDTRTYPWFADAFHHPAVFDTSPAYPATAALLQRRPLPYSS